MTGGSAQLSEKQSDGKLRKKLKEKSAQPEPFAGCTYPSKGEGRVRAAVSALG
jgi:hypothetical protein